MHSIVRRRIVAALIGILGALVVALPPTASAAWSAQSFLPGVPNDVYLPRIASEGNRFHVVFQRNQSNELYYSRGTANAFGQVAWENARVIANDVSNGWDVAASNDGTVHVGFVAGNKRIYYIRNAQRGDLGNWSAPEQIASFASQVNNLALALDAANSPYAAWGEGVNPSALFYAYRTAPSAWSRRQTGGPSYLYRYPALAVSGAGDAATVHILAESKNTEADLFAVVYAGGLRTSSPPLRGFSRAYMDSRLFAARPSLAIDRSTGALFAAFSGGRDLTFDLYFTYSTTNGSSFAPAVRDPFGGSTAVIEESPLVAGAGGAYVLFNTRRLANGGFVGSGFYESRFELSTLQFAAPEVALNPQVADQRNVNPDLAINELAKAVVWVTGFTERIAFSSEAGGLVDRPNATLTLNEGATLTNNNVLRAALTNVVGSPTQMQVALDGDPSDTTPAQPFQPNFSVTLPASSVCARTLSVVLINASGTRSLPIRAAITLDASVQTSERIVNPLLRGNLVAPATPPGVRVLNNGDPNYTRDASVYVEVSAADECTGLKQILLGRSAQSLGQPIVTPPRLYANILPIPAPVVAGPNPIVLAQEDLAGNTKLVNRTIIYDPDPPVLQTTGTLTVSVPVSRPNVLVTLVLSGNVVSDTLYGGRGFWGLWVANSRTAIANPANDQNLFWTAIQAPGTTADTSVPGWNLLNNIAPDQQTPGNYYVYVRFIDGAGNATTGVVSATVSLSEVAKPEARLPIVVR